MLRSPAPQAGAVCSGGNAMATNEAIKQEVMPIIGMTCANCVATVERNVKKLPGIQAADVNLANERMTVRYDPALVSHDDIIARVRKAGYDVPEAAAGE